MLSNPISNDAVKSNLVWEKGCKKKAVRQSVEGKGFQTMFIRQDLPNDPFRVTGKTNKAT